MPTCLESMDMRERTDVQNLSSRERSWNKCSEHHLDQTQYQSGDVLHTFAKRTQCHSTIGKVFPFEQNLRGVTKIYIIKTWIMTCCEYLETTETSCCKSMFTTWRWAQCGGTSACRTSPSSRPPGSCPACSSPPWSCAPSASSWPSRT